MTPVRFSVVLLFLALASASADVVINEIVHAASDRVVRWDGGVARLGPGVQWYESAYADTGWQTGGGPFGFGTVSPAPTTAVATNTQTQMQYLTPTLYLRKSFTVSTGDAAKTDPLELLVEYNDGFIVYVNGVEIARRWAGPAGQIHYHDQHAYDPDFNSTTADSVNNVETVNLGAANTRLVAGTNVIAVHALNLASTNTNFLFSGTLRIGGASPVTLVGATEAWRYFPGVAEPSAGLYDPTTLISAKLSVPWGRVNFDDATWSSGAGPIGEGVAGMGTTVSGAVGVTPSLYKRIVFNASAAQAADPAALRLLINWDDGYVAYINGVEVSRSNLNDPHTFVPNTAVATAARNYGTTSTITLDPANKLLVAGANVLAVQVHNVTIGDSDIAASVGLQTGGGSTLVSANSVWKYRVGTDEPVPDVDGAIEDNPDGPDSATDWVELHNNGAVAVSLNGWRITDDAGEPAKWIFPNVSIPAGGYFIVVCDGLDITAPTAGGYLHTNFSIDADGEYLALRDAGGVLVQEFAPAIPAGSKFHSYGRNGSGAYVFFDNATPGSANVGNEFSDRAATPTFSIPGGFYGASQSVSLSTATPGATIRYTLDGTEPTETNGSNYTGAISVTAVSGNKDGRVLRARAFATGMLPSDIRTETYLIGITSPQTTLPVISLVGDEQRSLYRPYGIMAIKENVAGAAGNFPSGPWSALGDKQQYNNVNYRGRYMERSLIWQMIYPNNSPGFNIEFGARMAGSPFTRPRYVLTDQNREVNPNAGAWSTNSSAQKPSMNFYTRDDLGGDPLDFPLIPGSPVTKHHTLRLRAGHNDMPNNPFVIDELMRRIHTGTGQQGSLGIHSALYINGIYKGLFNLAQRVREDWCQEVFQSDLKWDVIQVAVPSDGDLISFQEMFAFIRNNPPSVLANYQAMQQRLDMVNFADYLITNIYGCTGDWPHNNWIAARERSTAGLWRFFTWDAEGAFGGFSLHVRVNNFTVNTLSGSTQSALITNNPNTDALGSAARILYTLLRTSPEFRLLFADRVQKHFFHGGALTDANILAKNSTLVSEVLPFFPSINTTRIPTWVNGVGNITRYTTSGATNTPSRRQVLLGGYTDDVAGGIFVEAHLKSEGLWPATLAPAYSQHGGNFSPGFNLTITNPNGAGTIYYSTDGTDPRAAGGAAQGTAYTGAIPLSQSTTVRSRILNGGDWSPLLEATFVSTTTPSLLITEIMYNPPDFTPPGGGAAIPGSELEFVELKNTGATTLNLFGIQFAAGIDFAFPAGTTLAPGAFIVIAKNAAQFALKYPGVPVAGSYGPGSSLNNGGETITLIDAAGTTIASFTYENSAPWPISADGGGYSLVTAQPNSNPNPGLSTNWRASSSIGGSPGTDDPPSGTPHVLITEILANSIAPDVDRVEFHNPEASAADIGGWFFSDSLANPQKYRIPDGTIIPAGGYLTLDETHFNTGPNAFALSQNGDEAVLSSADSGGTLTGYTALVSFSASEPGVSLGEHINSLGQRFIVAQNATTFGSANSSPKISPVILSEIHYQPIGGKPEFIEIRNNSNAPAPLFDPANPSNTWRIDGIDFTFPPGVTLPPRAFALISANDPASFRTAYGIDPAIPIFGPFQPEELSNTGERIALQKPGTPYFDGTGTVVPSIDMDFVTYGSTAPWPTTPAGGGRSLERGGMIAFGDDPANWKASSATAGNPGKFGPASFTNWQTSWFTQAEIADPALSGPFSDIDTDGVVALIEYAFGLIPRGSDTTNLITTGTAMNGAAGPYFTVSYRRSLATTGTSITLEGAPSPAGPWSQTNPSTGTAYFVQLGVATNNGDGTETRTFRSDLPLSSLTQRYVRVKVTGP